MCKQEDGIPLSSLRRRRIAASFSAKSGSYDRFAKAQESILRDLVGMIPLPLVPGLRWLDIGCGTGMFAELIGSTGNDSIIVCLDVAEGALAVLRTKRISGTVPLRAEAERLPFRPGAFDLVVASSVLQWVDDAGPVVRAAASLLSPGGMFAFGVLLDGTLADLHRLQQEFGLEVPVVYPSEQGALDLLTAAGLVPEMTTTVVKSEHFASGMEVLRYISHIGSTAVVGHRLSPAQLRKFASRYDDVAGQADGIETQYRVLLGIARRA